jgi:hypothetical protein
VANKLGVGETQIKKWLGIGEMSEERKTRVRDAGVKDRAVVANEQLRAHRQEKSAHAVGKRTNQRTVSAPAPLDTLVATSRQALRSVESCILALEEFIELAEAAPADGVEIDPVLDDVSTMLTNIDSISDLGERLSSLRTGRSNASKGTTDDAEADKEDEDPDDENEDEDEEGDDEDQGEQRTPSRRPPPNAPRSFPRRSAIAAEGR